MSTPPPTAPEPPAICRLLDVRAVAARCGMDARTIYRYADVGLMPWGRRIGSLRRWDAQEIDNWIAGGCRPVRQGVRP
jgi:predicted DNA-binding transcriptional regulator AlpA